VKNAIVIARKNTVVTKKMQLSLLLEMGQ